MIEKYEDVVIIESPTENINGQNYVEMQISKF